MSPTEGASSPEVADTPPTIHEWLFVRGLYAKARLINDDGRLWQRILRTDRGVSDSYCPGCGRQATFRALPTKETETALETAQKLAGSSATSAMLATAKLWNEPFFEIALDCTRGPHGIRFYFAWQRGTEGRLGVLQKVGQFPSLADISFPETRRFGKTLGESGYAEYRRGLGLFAHGANIGAFVYLRRIFEGLVENAHKLERSSQGWDEDAYQRAHADEQIAMLAHALPKLLVDNANMYGILSKGIHELSEDECGKYFGLVRSGIELILEDVLAAEERAQSATRLTKAVAEVTGQLRNK